MCIGGAKVVEGGDRQQQHLVIASHLEVRVPAYESLTGHQLSTEQLQQRRLPCSIRADEGEPSVQIKPKVQVLVYQRL